MIPNYWKDRDFPQFARLATELRLMVWRQCLPRRALPLEFQHFDARDRQKEDVTAAEMYQQYERLPLVSRVCKESRRIAFECGKIIELPARIYENHPETVRMQPVWFDFSRDTILLPCQVDTEHTAATFGQLSRDLPRGCKISVTLDDTIDWDGWEKVLLEATTRKAWLSTATSSPAALAVLQIRFRIDSDDAAEIGIFGQDGADTLDTVAIDDTKTLGALFENRTGWVLGWGESGNPEDLVNEALGKIHWINKKYPPDWPSKEGFIRVLRDYAKGRLDKYKKHLAQWVALEEDEYKIVDSYSVYRILDNFDIDEARLQKIEAALPDIHPVIAIERRVSDH